MSDDFGYRKYRGYNVKDFARLGYDDFDGLVALKERMDESLLRLKDRFDALKNSPSFSAEEADDIQRHRSVIGGMSGLIRLAIQGIRSQQRRKEFWECQNANLALARERDEARELCQKLAGEIESLSKQIEAVSVSASRSETANSFVEVARIVLAETTFNRIMERVNERVRGKQATR